MRRTIASRGGNAELTELPERVRSEKAAMFQGEPVTASRGLAPNCTALPLAVPGGPSSSAQARHQPKCLDNRRGWVTSRGRSSWPPTGDRQAQHQSFVLPRRAGQPSPHIPSDLLCVDGRSTEREMNCVVVAHEQGREGNVRWRVEQPWLDTRKAPDAAGFPESVCTSRPRIASLGRRGGGAPVTPLISHDQAYSRSQHQNAQIRRRLAFPFVQKLRATTKILHWSLCSPLRAPGSRVRSCQTLAN